MGDRVLGCIEDLGFVEDGRLWVRRHGIELVEDTVDGGSVGSDFWIATDGLDEILITAMDREAFVEGGGDTEGETQSGTDPGAEVVPAEGAVAGTGPKGVVPRGRRLAFVGEDVRESSPENVKRLSLQGTDAEPGCVPALVDAVDGIIGENDGGGGKEGLVAAEAGQGNARIHGTLV